MSVPEPAPGRAETGSMTQAPGSCGEQPETAGGQPENAGGQNAERPGAGAADPRLPWTGQPSPADILCLAGIALSGLYYLALLPFRADLVGTHPVLLEVLNGSTEAIVSAAAFARVGHGTLLTVLLAAIPGLMKFDLFFWWAGKRWGERYIMLLSGRRNRGARYMGWVKRWGRWFSWPAVVVCPFLPIPTAVVYVVVGWAGMSLVVFVVLDVIGSLLWAGMLAGLGYALGHHAVVVAQGISRYGLWFTLAIVVLIVISQVRRARATASAPR